MDIRRTLLDLLRSTDETFIFKYAMSPYDDELDSFNVIGSAQAGHDFDVVNLTHGRRQRIDNFSRQLVERVLSARGIRSSPRLVFGRSITSDRDSPRARGPKPYAVGSQQHQVISRLALDDPSFAQYLLDHNIQVEALNETSPRLLHTYVRKVIHYVAIRDAYRVPYPEGSPHHTSLLPYCGVPLIYALCEGNPRLLIGVVTTMLPLADGERVAPPDQAAVIREAVARLRSLLRTIGAAGAEKSSNGDAMNLLQFLDRIGRYFRHVLLDEAFTSDPPGSFTVDERALSRYASVIGLALNAGAIIHVSEGGTRVLRDKGDLLDERFRLSYLLGAYYRLPLRLDRSVSLSAILDRTRSEGQLTLLEQRLPGFEDWK